jgi:hypothetical protein
MACAALNTAAAAQTKGCHGVRPQAVQLDLVAAADAVAIEAGLQALKGRIDTRQIGLDLSHEFKIGFRGSGAARGGRAQHAQIRLKRLTESLKRLAHTVDIGSFHRCHPRRSFQPERSSQWQFRLDIGQYAGV